VTSRSMTFRSRSSKPHRACTVRKNKIATSCGVTRTANNRGPSRGLGWKNILEFAYFGIRYCTMTVTGTVCVKDPEVADTVTV
jgi:hypothetical protein